MHDPVGLDALRGTAGVEDEGLLDAEALGTPSGEDGLVGARGLPVSRCGCPVWPGAVWIFPVTGAVEEPFSLAEVGLVYNQMATGTKAMLFLAICAVSDCLKRTSTSITIAYSGLLD